jgi:hypothetical protein
MHESREMNHLNDHCHGHVTVLGLADGAAGEADEGRTQLFATRAQGVFGVTGKIGIKGADLLAHPLGNGLKERFQRQNNLFPIDRGRGEQRD